MATSERESCELWLKIEMAFMTFTQVNERGVKTNYDNRFSSVILGDFCINR